MTYRRKLSPVERTHAATGRSPFTFEGPRYGMMVIEGEGELDPGVWSAALERAAYANPGSRVVLRGHLLRSRWEAVASGTPRLRVVEGAGWDGRGSEGFDALLDTGSHAPLSLRKGPTGEVVLVPGEPPRVLIRLFHAVSDGGGTLHLAFDLFRCLRGEQPVGSDSTMTDAQLMATIEGGQLPVSIKGSTQEWQQPTGALEGTERGDVWRRVDLPGAHSQLLARVALATARFAWAHGEGEVRFSVPVDLRRHVPDLRSTANLTGLALLDVPRDATVTSIDDALRAEIAAGNHAALPRIAHLLSLIPLRFLDFGMGRRPRTYLEHHRGKFSGMITNLGRVPLERFSGAGFRATATFIPPVPDNFFIGITGDEHGAHLTVGTTQLFATRGRLDAICAFIAEDVSSAAAR